MPSNKKSNSNTNLDNQKTSNLKTESLSATDSKVGLNEEVNSNSKSTTPFTIEENEGSTQASQSNPSNLAASTKTEDKTQVIHVIKDFAGDLEAAIAAANDGDIVKLGNKTYYTDGITIDKDITIDGHKKAVIDGDGTSGAIFHLVSDASGAIIRGVEITNANNGIFVEGASDITLRNLDINNIGITETMRDGANNTGIILDHAEEFRLLDSDISDIGRKAIGIIDTDGGLISNISVQDVNLEAEHAQSHDVAGVKFFNTNDITVRDSYFSDINGNYIWNDTANLTTIENNVLENVGEDFLAPAFNKYVDMSGISNEKSSNAVIRNNEATSVGDFLGLKATEFSTETMTLAGNDFDSFELGTTDYWVNEEAEKLVALTEDPDSANYSLFSSEYMAQANIGE